MFGALREEGERDYLVCCFKSSSVPALVVRKQILLGAGGNAHLVADVLRFFIC